MKEAWQKISTKIVFNTPWLRIHKNSYILQNGEEIPDYYIWEGNDAALCVCRVDDQFVLVRQYRPGIEKVTLCHPGGRIELSDASAREGAIRELVEETGYVPKSVVPMGAFGQVPAISPNRVHLFLAECEKAVTVKPSRDKSEEIEVELVPLTKLEELINSGIMDCVACVAATYMALAKIK
jgi:ADP-ribose pyrophosphatase